MQSQLRNIGMMVLMLVCLLLGSVGGVVLDREVFPAFAQQTADAPGQPGQAFDAKLIQQAWDRINQDYVDRSVVQGKSLTYAAISGMTDALGDTGHTRFMTPDMVKQENN